MNQPHTRPLVLTIEGMTCEGCVRAVRGALGAVPGVKALEVGLSGDKLGWARLEGEPSLDRAALEAAVEEAGFTLRALTEEEAR